MLVLDKIQNLPLDSQIGYLSQITEVQEPVARQILWCESRLNPKAININKNGTKDIGLGQINSIHTKDMWTAGLDINNPTDNLIYSFYLMNKNDLRDYRASKNCWSPVLQT